MRYRFLLAVTGLVLFLSTVWLLRAGGQGADAAAVLTFTLTALLVLLTIFPLPWGHKLTENEKLAVAAEGLARTIYDREAREQGKFLARGGDAKPADTEFSKPGWVFWRNDSGGQRGSLVNIVDFYDGLDRGRMVVLGAPGSGKTVMVNQLLLDRIKKLLFNSSSLRPGCGIPVRLSLPAFDLGDHKNDDRDAVVSSLLEWIADRLTEDFRLQRTISTKLVADGWILPILDGLDEMDADDSGRGEGETDCTGRAVRLIRALNVPVGGRLRPVVVSCRTDRYRKLSGIEAPGRESVLLNAATVELEPLSPEQVAAYLTDRFPDPSDQSKAENRWRIVIRHVKSRPNGQLALALSSPLRLFMAVTAYYLPHTKPRTITQVPKGDLDKHLFEKFIPAVTEQHPRNKGQGPYDPNEVEYWLGFIASHLDGQQPREEGSRNDLSLDQLWRFVGNQAPRYIAGVMHGLLTAGLLVIVADWYSFSAGYPLNITGMGQFAVFAGGVVIALVIWRSSDVRVVVSRLGAFPLRTVRGRREFAAGFARLLVVFLPLGAAVELIILVTHYMAAEGLVRLSVGAAIGISVGLVGFRSGRFGRGHLRLALVLLTGSLLGLLTVFTSFTHTYAPLIALFTIFLVVAIWNGFVGGVTQRPSAIDRPSDLVTQGRTYDLTLGFTIACVFGIVGGLVGWLGNSIGLTTRAGLAIGFAAGIKLGASVECKLTLAALLRRNHCIEPPAAAPAPPGPISGLGLQRWIAAVVGRLSTVPSSRASRLASGAVAGKHTVEFSGADSGDHSRRRCSMPRVCWDSDARRGWTFAGPHLDRSWAQDS